MGLKLCPEKLLLCGKRVVNPKIEIGPDKYIRFNAFLERKKIIMTLTKAKHLFQVKQNQSTHNITVSKGQASLARNKHSPCKGPGGLCVFSLLVLGSAAVSQLLSKNWEQATLYLCAMPATLG